MKKAIPFVLIFVWGFFLAVALGGYVASNLLDLKFNTHAIVLIHALQEDCRQNDVLKNIAVADSLLPEYLSELEMNLQRIIYRWNHDWWIVVALLIPASCLLCSRNRNKKYTCVLILIGVVFILYSVWDMCAQHAFYTNNITNKTTRLLHNSIDCSRESDFFAQYPVEGINFIKYCENLDFNAGVHSRVLGRSLILLFIASSVLFTARRIVQR